MSSSRDALLAECDVACTSGCHADDCEHHGHIPADSERAHSVEVKPVRPADIDLFAQRMEANAQRPSLAGWEALARDLLAALQESAG